MSGEAEPGGADATGQQLDRRPAWNEKPCAPADGSTVGLDPPAFVWLPTAKRPASYVLAISRAPDFPGDATIRVDNVPISVHVPTKPLGSGRWHWRVGVRTSNDSVAWSRSRSFTIRDDAQKWPFPNVDELMARIPHEHPRLLFPGKELGRAREQCPRLMPNEHASLLRAAERCIGEELIAEPAFERREDRGTGRAGDYVYIMRSTRPPMDKMETCALAYLLSGRRRFGEEAKRRLLHFFAWDPEGSTDLFHNDEPAMWVMQRGTRAYDWTYDLFTPEERARIEPVMKTRCEQFLKRLTGMPFESRPYSSHPARDVGFLGEAAICFIHEWPEARQWLEYVLKIYWSVYPAWAAEDGGWQEGPGYWRAYMGFAMHFAAALEKATDARLVHKPFFRNTPYYKLYTNPPYARTSPFGDGQHGGPGRGAGHLLYQFSTLLGDPYLRWYPEVQESGPGSGPMGFALADPKLEAKPPVDLPQARLFEGAGLVAMHGDLADPYNSAYLVLRSSPFGSISHGHADQNAFAIEAFGEALAIASGYYPWYSSPHHSNWTRETKAKNCVTVDGGIGQTKRSPQASGRIVRFLTGERYDYALADATPAYDGRLTKCLRHVIHFRPNAAVGDAAGTFVVVDELEAPKPVTFEWWLHALEEMQIDRNRREVLIRRGDARLRATFVVPHELEFKQTDRFDPPPENNAPNQWHLTASTASPSPSATFIVVLSPLRAGEDAPELTHLPEGGPPRIRVVDGRARFGARYDKDGLHGEDVFGWETDGRIFSFNGPLKGSPANILSVDATRISGRDDFHFESTAPTTVACSITKAGLEVTSDGPSCSVRLRTPAAPVTIRRNGKPVEFEFVDGLARFDLPQGRATTFLYSRKPDDRPGLTVVVDGEKQRLDGKRVGISRVVWRQRHGGPNGRFQLTLPAGLALIVGVEPVHGETVRLRRGQTLWWYGRAPEEAVVLERIDKAADSTSVDKKEDVTATFSIAAVDPETGVCGAAVASKYPAVGEVVPYVRAGVGAFCTQHWHNPKWGEHALDLLEQGKLPEEVLGELLRDDPKRDKRQLAIVDMQGRAANRNPANADPSGIYWGAMSGRYYACQGNTLTGREVVVAMAEAYEETKGSLADRLMAALVAGDRAGGDHRGRLAAGIRAAKKDVEGYWLELQVDKSDDAVTELARKYTDLDHPAKGEWPGVEP
ncbi:MAG: DUF1028 domain-containing protein [Planctomycetota bacterium]|jgi:uncharacterized Ntn-hydrolase superfamily protein